MKNIVLIVVMAFCADFCNETPKETSMIKVANEALDLSLRECTLNSNFGDSQ